MLTCSKCNLEKPEEYFYKDARTKTGFYWACKECVSLVRKARYAKDPTQKRAYAKAQKAKLKQDMVTLFGNKCHDCGETYPPPVYDFHHTDPDKKDYAPRYAITHLSKEKVLTELAKCVMLCANCHRIRHWKML